MDKSPALKGKTAKWYAENYYSVEDDIIPIFEKLDTPFLDKRLKPGMKVFDAMMGRGRHALRYAKRGCEVWGNDYNPHMVSYARKAAKHLGVKVKLTALDATALKGVHSGQFDAVIAMFSAIGTIPGSKNRQKALDEFARVVKPGGIVIIHAHNRWDTVLKPMFWNWMVRSYLGTDRKMERGDIISDYNSLEGMFNHFYSPREFRASFRKAGLDVVEEAYMDYSSKRFLKGPLRKFKADGFIFVGRKTSSSS
jgi:ubiquinone/menaquinone biosynthesis C-methylase UbiE